MNNVKASIIGHSALGQPIEMFKKTHTVTSKPFFLFVGGVHGDEPEGVEMAQKLLEWLKKEASSAEHRPWALIPCLNVDGYQKNERTNGNGVDLNRNFPSPDWSAENARGPRYSPGSHAASEPEVKALIEVVKDLKPEIIFHFHSWEPCVVYTGAPARPYAELVSPDSRYPVREDIGYPTPGSLGQYGWLVHKIPVICIEEQEKIELSRVWPNFHNGFKKLFDHEMHRL